MAAHKLAARKYTPIWEKLKRDKKCSLTVPPHLLARVKKGVIKEKDMDIPFKLLDTPDYDKWIIKSEYDKGRQVLKLELFIRGVSTI